MDSRNFKISNAALAPSVQHAVLDDQQPNLAEQGAFEQRRDAARVADPLGLARRPGRKPPPNVSGADYDYIHEIVARVSTHRKLSASTAEKYLQMLYKVAAFLGKRGRSLEGTDDSVLNQLSDTVFKENKHVGMALRALQEQRGGSPAVNVRRVRAAASVGTGRTPVAPTEADAPLIESVIDEGIKSKHWAPATAQHHDIALRKLSHSLGLRGETLAGTSDDALVEFIKEDFPKNWRRMTGSILALGKHRGGSEGSKKGAFASDGVDQTKNSPVAGPSRLDADPGALWRLLDDHGAQRPVMSEDPARLRQEQELRDPIEGGCDDQSTLLPASVDPEEFTSGPENLIEQPAKRRRALESQSLPCSASVDSGGLSVGAGQFAVVEPSQLLDYDSARLEPDRFAGHVAESAELDAFTFVPPSLSPGEPSRLMNNEPALSEPDQHAQEGARSLDAEASGVDRAHLSPGELWRLLDDEPTLPLPDLLFHRHAGSIDPNVFSSEFLPPPRELTRLRDDTPAPDGLNELGGHMLVMADRKALDFEYLPFSPGELRGLLDDERATSSLDQPASNLPASTDPDALLLSEEQMPPGELWRLLDDEPASSAADQAPRLLPGDY
ncbi:hypothetical protein [Bradyrhizobium sp. Arg816]|uniref:hypothetical protein n=1 Tax=Bradyrhizobium sp. Arg816 TaxID=2998491 RepID=UPI00249EFBF0|nr:hypothetical protein [Bradyrhizobium sp. Arg816]MDI3567365.1 hypothetical protein [Bradyrhizobium sp. Arg816]